MSVVVLAARVAIGAVFVASGLLKSRDRSWPATGRAFGAPAWVIPVLPWVELTVGVLAAAQFRAAALAALALLSVFTVGVVVHLARGEHVPCGCFGQRSVRPIGPSTLARNLVLCAVAVVAVL